MTVRDATIGILLSLWKPLLAKEFAKTDNSCFVLNSKNFGYAFKTTDYLVLRQIDSTNSTKA